MNRSLTLSAIALAALTLSSCSNSESADQPAPSSTVTSSSTSSSTTSGSAPSSSSASENSEPALAPATVVEPDPVEQQPAATQPAANSIWAPVGTGYQCPGTDAFVYDPANCTSANLGGDPSYDSRFPGGQDLSNIPVADGGTCPAAICGYGTDANGNPNPSSGELQTIHGCSEGYITDAALCDAVNAKAEQYGW